MQSIIKVEFKNLVLNAQKSRTIELFLLLKNNKINKSID